MRQRVRARRGEARPAYTEELQRTGAETEVGGGAGAKQVVQLREHPVIVLVLAAAQRIGGMGVGARAVAGVALIVTEAVVRMHSGESVHGITTGHGVCTREAIVSGAVPGAGAVLDVARLADVHAQPQPGKGRQRQASSSITILTSARAGFIPIVCRGRICACA
jgi:hypothetical protein